MKVKLNSLFPRSCAAAAVVALSLLSTQSIAHEYKVGDIEVVHPYAPPTPPGAGMAAGYVEIINHGDEDDRLISGKVYFAHEMQVHQTEVVDDVSRMRQVEGGLLIPAGTTVKLEPLGTHIMFTDLAEPLVEAGRHSATLTFEKAGDVEVEFSIEHPNSDSMQEMHGDDMEMGEEGSKMKGMKHH
ncbi:copper chaperone PCu(A)C [Granulosicoccus antarcticus]|uniref:Copper chaperone PCu(A)C n=1 Tax=Granulosicoccus antarcticus IMCC3135 TaxID=1192854 RepID=A0A2Z2NGX4_9GAMM|nr:copper chaperone PCu(A)C [Granulosicoccus antarcticus]ASJ70532.1 hypothetical protein IMCC3135_02090 [Granulosicoccus antarcticus IMCC3135]